MTETAAPQHVAIRTDHWEDGHLHTQPHETMASAVAHLLAVDPLSLHIGRTTIQGVELRVLLAGWYDLADEASQINRNEVAISNPVVEASHGHSTVEVPGQGAWCVACGLPQPDLGFTERCVADPGVEDPTPDHTARPLSEQPVGISETDLLDIIGINPSMVTSGSTQVTTTGGPAGALLVRAKLQVLLNPNQAAQYGGLLLAEAHHAQAKWEAETPDLFDGGASMDDLDEIHSLYDPRHRGSGDIR